MCGSCPATATPPSPPLSPSCGGTISAGHPPSPSWTQTGWSCAGRRSRPLAAHKQLRQSPSKTKVELWVLFPSGGLLRNLALDDRKLLPGHVAKATSLFGSDAWKRIYQARKAQQIDGQEARERYVNLYRWQLEQDLGYRRAHPIEVKDNRDRPIYHLIFATD